MKNKKASASDYLAINKFINYMLFLAKYAALILCVLMVAVTMFLGMMLVMKGEHIPADTLSETISFVTDISSDEATNIVATIGSFKVTVAIIGYTIAVAISTGLLRVILGKYKDIFNSIVSGNAYDTTTLEEINDCIPLSILLTFIQPILICLIIVTIGIFDYNTINVSGIIFLGISYIGKLLIESGNDLYKRNMRLSKELSDIKAYESELKMSALKKQAEAKKEEKVVSKKETKKAIKTEDKKSTQKKEETKKAQPATKKVTKKDTKKTTTK